MLKLFWKAWHQHLGSNDLLLSSFLYNCTFRTGPLGWRTSFNCTQVFSAVVQFFMYANWDVFSDVLLRVIVANAILSKATQFLCSGTCDSVSSPEANAPTQIESHTPHFNFPSAWAHNFLIGRNAGQKMIHRVYATEWRKKRKLV